MGASNSTPQTVPIENPANESEEMAIMMSNSVVQRLAKAQQQFLQDTACKDNAPSTSCTCGAKPAPIPPDVLEAQAALLQKSALELQEEQFKKTMARMERMFGKPINWAEEHQSEIKKLRQKVIQCYNECPQQPLLCNEHAAEFQEFVFREQMASMMQHKLQLDRERHVNEDDCTEKCRAATAEESVPERRSNSCGAMGGGSGRTTNTGIKVGGDCRDPNDDRDV